MLFRSIKGKKYIELTNKSNGVFFTTKHLKTLNDENKELLASYTKKQNSLVKEVISIAGASLALLRGTGADEVAQLRTALCSSSSTRFSLIWTSSLGSSFAAHRRSSLTVASQSRCSFPQRPDLVHQAYRHGDGYVGLA